MAGQKHRERDNMHRVFSLPSSSAYSPLPLTVSTLNHKSTFHSHSFTLSSSLNGNSSNVSSTSTPSPSRRLALFQLAAAIPESQLVGVSASKLLGLGKNVMEDGTFRKLVPVSDAVAEQNGLAWVNNDRRRMLHAVFSVADLDKTIKFYTECLGMKLLRKRDIPQERYSNAFLGYGPEESNFTLELTYNYGVDKYKIGNGFGHFGVVVEDCAKSVSLVKAKGGTVVREPGVIKEGNTATALVEDPTGYKFELLERGPTPEPLCQVMLRVGDLDRSISFYKKAFGMQLLRRKDSPESQCTVAIMGYGPEDKNAVLELTYNYGIKEYDKGNGYTQIAIGTNDVYKSANVIKLCGGKIVREPGPIPGINTKIVAFLDPDGWKSVFVDNADFLRELE